ncbi:hypothetical protein BRADI_2g36873v3 [Brachypodium distachyon]|uniref:CCHC-type domain-containing protein n=1 Tax=Brachypodium distachyon TaxID=15368 RepID=A0A2K2DC85_BRADI|nr:hypothetical protein BRADI_2g36873v3 [Brachypodium distachyon]
MSQGDSRPGNYFSGHQPNRSFVLGFHEGPPKAGFQNSNSPCLLAGPEGPCFFLSFSRCSPAEGATRLPAYSDGAPAFSTGQRSSPMSGCAHCAVPDVSARLSCPVPLVGLRQALEGCPVPGLDSASSVGPRAAPSVPMSAIASALPAASRSRAPHGPVPGQHVSSVLHGPAPDPTSSFRKRPLTLDVLAPGILPSPFVPVQWLSHNVSSSPIPRFDSPITGSDPPLPNVVALDSQATVSSVQPVNPLSYAQTLASPSPYILPSPSRPLSSPIPASPNFLRRCHRCLATDHQVADCRDPERCRRCWSFGHRQSSCPSLRSQTSLLVHLFCWEYALEAIMYDVIPNVFINIIKLSLFEHLICIIEYVI